MDDGLILNVDLNWSGPPKFARIDKPSRASDTSPKVPKRRHDDIGHPSQSKKTEYTDEPPRKRPKIVTAARSRPSAVSNSGPSTNSSHALDAPPVPRYSGQIISSLFTSNPVVDLPAAPLQPTKTEAPSNAPLKDSSTFEGLGLNPLISKHLKEKMGFDKPTGIQRAALSAILSQEPSETRDLFIQSQTGSGKTLSFLLPIINDLMPLSSLSYIDRSIGTLAIIIAPTRELAKQISDVLEALLQMRLRENEEVGEDMGPRLTRWLVSGLLVGGGTRSHEKARLRKGVPILVATPGRLLDHLQNTESFHVAKCRWLVLDEADHLMELGFQETLEGIIRSLEGRRRIAANAAKSGTLTGPELIGGWDWDMRRKTILCSATMREDVQKLAGTALVNPLVVKGSSSELSPSKAPQTSQSTPSAPSTKFAAPSQLSQKYVVVPLKLRLVSLVSLLKSILHQAQYDTKRMAGNKGSKVIVFLSCTDSVDFHWELLRGTTMDDDGTEGRDPPDTEDTRKDDENVVPVEAKATLIPGAAVFRLHGNLPLSARQASVKGFSTKPMSILLCTSVASRGLDLPLVRAVVQYDLPTEGGATEYIHRVGRTARVGKGGEAWAFVAPEEIAWVQWVEERMDKGSDDKTGQAESHSASRLTPVDSENVLKAGFGGSGVDVQKRATDVQLALERWVLSNGEHSSLARKAFQSHMRAYATHPSDEKHIFHIRHLHIGHLAKAFALRDTPSNIKATSNKTTSGKGATRGADKGKAGAATRPSLKSGPVKAKKLSVAERMRLVMAAQGRKTTSASNDEFQVASSSALRSMGY